MSPLSEARRQIGQGRYTDALAVLADVPPTSFEYPDAVLLGIRAAAEHGRFRRAAELAATPLPEPAAGRARLWLAFVSLYTAPDRGTVAWERLYATAEAGTKSSDLATRALAADLTGRGMALRVLLGRVDPTARPAAVTALRSAEKAYQAAGDPPEARRAALRSAHFLGAGPRADRTAAYGLFTLIAAEAEEPDVGDQVTGADARLALAERDWDQHLAFAPVEADLGPWCGRFEALAERYSAAGHATGPARVQWAFAQVLLRYGFTVGINLALTAADALEAVGERATQLAIWQELHLWHTVHGEPAEARAARERSEALNQHMELPFAAGGDELAFADAALRAGRYGEAEGRLRAVLADPALADLHCAGRLVLASVLSRSGRIADAVSLYSEAIAAMPDGDPFLTDALLSRATLRYDTRPAESDADFERLLGIALGTADPAEEARFRIARGWVRADSRRRKAHVPHLDDAVLADFRATESLLAPLRTLAARRQLGSLCQQWGQAAYAGGDQKECGRLLTAAEGVFRPLGLRPDLAFTLVHQALVLVGIGRQTGTACYRLAAERLAEAGELFGQSGLTAMVWNTRFYQGIAAREEGTGWAAGDYREQLLRAAAEHFEQASRAVDVERGTLTDRPGREGQEAGTGFVRDKQELYREGFQLAAVIRRDPVDAVRWLERMKGRAMLDAIAAEFRPPAALCGHPLIAQDVDLRERKNAAVHFDERAELHQQIEANLAEMASDPGLGGYAAMRRADTLSWQDTRAAMRSVPRVLVVLFAAEGGRVQVFGLRAHVPAPLHTQPEVDATSLADFARHIFADGNGGKRMKDLALDRRWSEFAPLVARVADWSDPGDPVVLVPHRHLHNLPLHLLPVDGCPLADRNPVTYAPSASVWCHTLLRRPTTSTTAAVFGDPTGDRPAVRVAAVAAATLFGCEPVLGPEVTRDRLLAGLAAGGWFLYGGHGEFDGADGLNAALLLGNGVRVTAADMLDLPRTPPLVVLAGCVTGVSQQRPGDELAGLVPALLIKGTRAVVASQWKVPAAATGALIRELAQGWAAGIDPANAFRTAVRRVRETPGWEHPYYWSGFVIHGFG